MGSPGSPALPVAPGPLASFPEWSSHPPCKPLGRQCSGSFLGSRFYSSEGTAPDLSLTKCWLSRWDRPFPIPDRAARGRVGEAEGVGSLERGAVPCPDAVCGRTVLPHSVSPGPGGHPESTALTRDRSLQLPGGPCGLCAATESWAPELDPMRLMNVATGLSICSSAP